MVTAHAVMFINILLLIVSVSIKLKFKMVEDITKRTEHILLTTIKIVNMCKQQYQTAITLPTNRDFECLRERISRSYLNNTP